MIVATAGWSKAAPHFLIPLLVFWRYFSAPDMVSGASELCWSVALRMSVALVAFVRSDNRTCCSQLLLVLLVELLLRVLGKMVLILCTMHTCQPVGIGKYLFASPSVGTPLMEKHSQGFC